MTIHTPHESTLEVGLVDGCPRCGEHAADPLASLDSEHITDLWQRMLAVEFDDDGRYRTENEATACRVLYRHALFLQKTGTDPRGLLPGAPISRRTMSFAAGMVVGRILDAVEGDDFALTLTRSVVDGETSFGASCSWADYSEARFGADPLIALTVLAKAMDA